LLRILNIALVLAAAAVLALGPSAANGVAWVGLALVAALAGSSERTVLAAGWTALCIAVAAAGLPGTFDGVAVAIWGLVSAAYVGIAWHSGRMRSYSLVGKEMSEVARRKLQRSNLELRGSMDATEEALAKLTTVLDTLSEGLVAVTADGTVEVANPAVARLFELPEVSPGTPVDDAISPEVGELVRRCLDAGELKVAELPLPAGRIGLAAASPVSVKDGMWGAVILVRDVTLDREIDRMKSDFAATVSHEMRTPLTSILGFTKVVRNQLERRVFPIVDLDEPGVGKAVKKIQGNLDIVLEEGQRLTALINDVLDIAKMESGQIDFRFESHAPGQLVQRSVEATEALFTDRTDLERKVTIPPDLPPVHADRDRVLQVLINLIANALKFTETGVVEVAAVASGDAVEFSVRDTGVGIRPAHLDEVFKRFKQVGDTLTDRPQGTGLGLPICREIVTAHGGTIWVDSEPGAGSRFAFTIPVAQEA